MNRPILSFLIVFLFVLSVQQALSADLTGKRQIKMTSGAGEDVIVGTVTFEKNGTGYSYFLNLDDEKFADHFLSMRPFKCLEGNVQYLCHLPYPYEKTHRIGPKNFTDLEHEFLFIHKKPNDYGINMWNGLYYVISETQTGLTGRLHELDMDILASPPEAGVMYPLLDAEKMEANRASHWFPHLMIE